MINNIYLSLAQKNQLLEMCNALLSDNAENGITLDHPYGDTVVVFHNDGGTIRIHWFELCCTHLFDKIHPDMPLGLTASNPISDLYEEYKEIQT